MCPSVEYGPRIRRRDHGATGTSAWRHNTISADRPLSDEPLACPLRCDATLMAASHSRLHQSTAGGPTWPPPESKEMHNVTTHSTTRLGVRSPPSASQPWPGPVMADPDGPAGPPGGCADTTNVIVGGPGNDVILGTPQNDLILGGGGDDRINGRGGHDTIRGGNGDDTVLGARGNDCVAGDAGKDKVNGDQGRDNVSGGTGRRPRRWRPGGRQRQRWSGVRHPHDLPGRGQRRERRELSSAAVSRRSLRETAAVAARLAGRPGVSPPRRRAPVWP